MKIVSVNLGERKRVQWKNKSVETGIFKFPVDQPIFLDVYDVKKDTVVDRKYHGGIDKAVYGYGAQHYDFWKELHPGLDWNYGMFGENLTIANLNETNIYVGNVYKIGEAKIEVTKPREPCYKLGIRFQNQTIVRQFWNSTKSGVYFKVIETGNVSINDELILLKESTANPTIAEVYKENRKKKT